jgi:exonuclease I
MKEDFTQFTTEEERNRWATWAREWLADENKKFGESLQRLLTSVLIGNTAGIVTLVRMIDKNAPPFP